MTARERALKRVVNLRAVAKSEGDTPQGKTALSIAESLARKHGLTPVHIAAAEAAREAQAQRSPRAEVAFTESRYWVQSAYITLALTVGVPAAVVGKNRVQIGPGAGPTGWIPSLVRYEMRKAVEQIEAVGAEAVSRLVEARRQRGQQPVSATLGHVYIVMAPPRLTDEAECLDAAWFVVANEVLSSAVTALSKLSEDRVQELIRRMAAAEPPPKAESAPPPKAESAPPPKAESAPPPKAESAPPPKAESAPPPKAESAKASPTEAPAPGAEDEEAAGAMETYLRGRRILGEARSTAQHRGAVQDQMHRLRALGLELAQRWTTLDTAEGPPSDAPSDVETRQLSGPVQQ